MSLQNVFYLTVIIVAILAIVLLAALVILTFYIMRKMGELSHNLNQKLDAAGRIVEQPGQVAAEVGSALASEAIHQVKQALNRRRA